jgi:PAS domain S-box-containing protein
MPLASRFTITFGVLILVLFFGVGLLLEAHMTRQHRNEAALRLSGITRSLNTISMPYLLNYDYVSLQQIADDAMREPGLVQAMILDKEGVIAGLTGRRDRVGQRAEDPVSLRALVAMTPLEFERPGPGGFPMLERIEPVYSPREGTRWGTVRVSLSLQGVAEQTNESRMLILQVALGGVLLAIIASHLLARRVSRSLGVLMQRADGLARGEWDLGVKLQTGDEIEVLDRQFAQAAESLGRQQQEIIDARDELARLNATLEEKVKDRTKELLESKEKYRLLVDASPDPLSVLQGDHFRFVNDAFLEIFGYTEERVYSSDFTLAKVLHPDFVRIASEVIDRALQHNAPIDTDWVGIGRGGKSLDFSVRGRPVTYQGEQAVQLLWVDLTERKRLLRQIVQNERLRGVGEMTAMVAHNFNNLLAVILGRTQLMQAKTADAGLQRGLEIVRTAALQGSEIVRRIQDYTGDSGDPQFSEVQVGAILRDVASYLENYWRVGAAGNAPVQFEVHAEQVPPVLGSEPLLSDVFKHVMVNAAEAMPGGGTVKVCVMLRGAHVLVQVEDTGVGITAETRRRAFDPFFTTKGPQNRGLGLSASFGIVQRHRGRIDLRPREQGGAAVEILLPAHRSPRSHPLEVDASVVIMSEEEAAARRLKRRLQGPPGNGDEWQTPGKQVRSA